MSKISIITPVWNRSDLTHRFLAQHWAIYAGYSDFEIIIVDNGSTDGTQSVLNNWLNFYQDHRLKVVTLGENTGFGPGNNRGVEVATGDILAFVSNDVNVNGDYIAPIQAAMENDPLGLYGAEIFSHNTGWNTFEEIGTIPYVAGWCVVAERQFWQKIGTWDEQFIPCDYEDLDLSYRVKQANFPLIELDLPLKHDSGKSAERLPEGRTRVTLENQRRFLDKWELTLV